MKLKWRGEIACMAQILAARVALQIGPASPRSRRNQMSGPACDSTTDTAAELVRIVEQERQTM
ncbi:hypothetical protein EXE55_02265 [Burkholderia glumae]|nr:hypothetical protein EXE55_02265 [Burkholderia glumae]